MTPNDRGAGAAAARGDKLFSVFDYVVKIVVVTLAALGLIILIVELSGVGMAHADEHEILRHRGVAAAVLIVGYLVIDWLLARRRLRRSAEGSAPVGAAILHREFALSVDPDADRRAADAAAAARAKQQARPRRSYAVESMAVLFVAAGGVAFWHDHMSHEIPRVTPVPAAFVSAKCLDRISRRIGGSVAPHMSVIYEFVSLSTSPRMQEMACFLDNCEAENTDKKPKQYPDTAEKRSFYPSKAACEVALPAVLAAKSTTTVWTGDKPPDAAVRARFTPERAAPPYFLLWFPGVVAAVMLLISGFARWRSAR